MDITPYANNAKKHPDSQLVALAAEVARVGWRQPILVNQHGVIIAGHGRWMTWKKYGPEFGLKEPWVVDDTGKTVMGGPETRPLTREEEETYRLADNKLNESEWDMKIVVPILRDLPHDLVNLTGFSTDLLLEDDDKDDVLSDFESAEPVSRMGDVYELGEHRVMVGDSTDPAQVEKLMNGKLMNCVFTDPPYNINYSGSGKNTSTGIENDDMSEKDFDDFLDKAFANYRNHMRRDAGMYVFHDERTRMAFERSVLRAGFEVKQQLIWNKPSAGLGMGDYRRKHEPFLYCAIAGQSPAFHGDRTHGSVIDLTESEADLIRWAKKVKRLEKEGKTTVWSVPREKVGDYLHPTQKPVALALYAIKNSSKSRDIVGDLFLGSGTTLIAAEKSGRACYGMEYDPRFADKIVDRYCRYVENPLIIKNGKEMLWTHTT